MILEKFRYGFLGRMRRSEGLAPLIERDLMVDLGASPSTIFEASLAASLLFAILVFIFFPTPHASASLAPPPQEFVTFEEIENTRQLNRPPPPPRPAIPIAAPPHPALGDA